MDQTIAGEIHIGKPPMKTGDMLIVLDGGTRYGIIEASTNTENESLF